jgi:hypothetical protein
MRPSLDNLSTPGVFFATIYAGLVLYTVAYGILFADSPTDLPLLAVILFLPWVFFEVPLSFYLEVEMGIWPLAVFALINTVLMYRFGKKLGQYFAA